MERNIESKSYIVKRIKSVLSKLFATNKKVVILETYVKELKTPPEHTRPSYRIQRIQQEKLSERGKGDGEF